MMGIRSEFDKLIKAAEEQKVTLQKLRRLLDREDDDPAPEPTPVPRFKSKFQAGSQEWYRELQLRAPREDEGISMNALARRFGKKPRPPRAPGRQQKQSNTLWSWWK